ncbi:helix-turn-helix transcriptional regulator [Pantoea dispersa]|uniref:helix-turn-helix transcriptional regulator n=2 Tax=Pantoea dispersa TaxID=59814 RepID=UPI0029057BF2|nr:LuxR C-terminal-related transcriptional regulator [Pantoea dispersa]
MSEGILLIVKGIHGKSVVLSDVETIVIWFIMTGLKLEYIAYRVGMRHQSVSYLKRRIMRKLGAKNNNELIVWYISQRRGLSLINVKKAMLKPFNKGGRCA